MRYLAPALAKDLKRKPILLTGPRQCGKTFLSRHLGLSFDYLNYDIPKDQKRLLKMDWSRQPELIVLDELHKMKKWKSWLKGVFDNPDETQKFLVTGSAKLNTFRKVGDSLAGRYLYYRLYPLDLKEVAQLRDLKTGGHSIPRFLKQLSPDQLLDRLLSRSGFPEPFLTDEEGYYERWQQTHLDIILKQDILELETIRNIKQLETLTSLLTERVGSPLSYNSLREDLSTDDKSIKRWVETLENSYVIFRIHPFVPKSYARAIRKAPKVYFMDPVQVENSAARLENVVALALLKEIHFRMDTRGERYDLHYLRDKQQNEIDFLVTKNNHPHLMIEVKESDSQASSNFALFSKYLPGVPKIQLVKNLKKPHLSRTGVQSLPLAEWLTQVAI